jgi:hypothetical protein
MPLIRPALHACVVVMFVILYRSELIWLNDFNIGHDRVCLRACCSMLVSKFIQISMAKGGGMKSIVVTRPGLLAISDEKYQSRQHMKSVSR